MTCNGDSCRAFTTLDESLVSKLHEYYQQSDSEYRNFTHEYESAKSRSFDALSFPPLSQWSPSIAALPDSVMGLKNGPTNQAKYLRVCSIVDKLGRKTKFSTADSETKGSVYSSSYIYLNPGCQFTHGRLVFGHIEQICKHTFNSKPHTLAIVHWFDGYAVDRGSGLHYVDITSHDPSMCSVVSLRDLLRPLIHAIEDNVLWILNCEV